jgi:RimJ/RimL family protein N-acetyltransferase
VRTVETDNPGSLRLLEKLGFEVKEVDPKNPWPEVKGGGFRECARLERTRLDGKE